MTAASDSQTIGRVALTVRDLAAVRDFYERVVGLSVLEAEDGRAVLGAGELSLVELIEDRDAPPRPARTTGLFHLAVLVPDRVELARSLRRLVEARWPLQGASDHLVSEALYLADPEGNGIEIYRDRPREDWRRDGDEIAMATLPLDLNDVLAELALDTGTGDTDLGAPSGTRIGHVHLNVADIPDGERFYSGQLGLDVTARSYPGALFLSAGGYHHHVGLNTWRGEGAPSPPPGALGLRWFELTPPAATATGDVADPSGNVVHLGA
jgi:catechol 2,3-dioxygenase